MTKFFPRNLWVIIALVAYGLFIATIMKAYAGGSDSSGYLNGAKLFLAGKLYAEQRSAVDIPSSEVSVFSYVPFGFAPISDEKMVPTYPFGLSIMIALFSILVGSDLAPHIVMWLHTIGSIILIYHFALLLKLEKFWAVIAAFLLAINPLFLSYSTQLMSDMPSLFWCSLTIFSSLRNTEKKWAVISGISAGMAVIIRPTNILIFIPLLIAFGRNWRGLIQCGLAGLPFAFSLLLLNHQLYGSYITTGYGDMSQFFGSEFIPFTINAYSEYLILELTPFLVLAIGVFVPSIWQKTKKEEWVILVWILAFLSFYSCYYFTHTTWWYMRFVLPIFPALILAMLMTLRMIYSSIGRMRRTLIIFFLSFTISWQISVILNKYVLDNPEGLTYFEMTNWAKENLPKDAVIFAMQDSGALFYYTDFSIVRYDSSSSEDIKKIRSAANKSEIPIYAAIHFFEFNDLKEKVPGNWQKLKTINAIEVWKLYEK